MMEEQFKIRRKSITESPVFKFNNKLNRSDLRNLVNEVESGIFSRKSWKTQFMHRAYFVLTELLNNAFRHGVSEKEIGLTINILDNKLLYLCENYIYTAQCQKLTEVIEPLNQLSGKREELMVLFKRKLSEEGLSTCRTTGLGLLDILRKTGERLVYNFKEKDEELSVLSIITTLNIKYTPL